MFQHTGKLLCCDTRSTCRAKAGHGATCCGKGDSVWCVLTSSCGGMAWTMRVMLQVGVKTEPINTMGIKCTMLKAAEQKGRASFGVPQDEKVRCQHGAVFRFGGAFHRDWSRWLLTECTRSMAKACIIVRQLLSKVKLRML